VEQKRKAKNLDDLGELKITKRSDAIFSHHSTLLQTLTIYLLSFATFSGAFQDMI